MPHRGNLRQLLVMEDTDIPRPLLCHRGQRKWFEPVNIYLVTLQSIRTSNWLVLSSQPFAIRQPTSHAQLGITIAGKITESVQQKYAT